jgi:hypothetical protein
MDERLPPPAELFLRSLAKALWALPSDERDAVVLELRGHLAERSDQGGLALNEALTALGSPDALARQFDQSGGGLAAVPSSFVTARRPLRTAEVIAEVRATFRASGEGLLLVGALLVTSLIATDFMSWMSIRLPEVGVNAVTVTAIRIIAVFAAFCAGYRLALSPRLPAWRVGTSTLAFSAGLAGATVVTIAGTVLIVRAATAVAATAGMTHNGVLAVKAAMALVTLAFFSGLLLRIQPWLAALAAERHGFTLRASWAGTRGRMGNILKGWAALVLPLYVLHFALNLIALKLLPFGAGTLALAGLDGIVSAGVAIAAILLNATAFRWSAGEPIPAPRPFGSERPDEALVEQARTRLRPLLQRRPSQPVKAE